MFKEIGTFINCSLNRPNLKYQENKGSFDFFGDNSINSMVQLRPCAMYLISFGAIIACIIVIPWRAEIGWPVMIKIHKIWWKIVHIVLVITKQWWDYRWYKYEASSTGYSKLCTWVSVSYSATCRDTKHKD